MSWRQIHYTPIPRFPNGGVLLFGDIADIMEYMRTIVEINNLTKKRIDPNFVKKIIRKTVKLSGTNLDLFEISVVFVEKKEIRKLNRTWRKKDRATDVLSFLYSSGYNKGVVEGEIFLCLEVIEKSAGEHQVSFKKELAFVLSHGILHLLGWRHGKKMYGIQDKVVQKMR